MIQQLTGFDINKDLNEVDQFGFFDLTESLLNGIVPENIGTDDLQYNGIEDPSTIAGKPRDVFQAVDAGLGLDAAYGQINAANGSDE